MVQQPVPVRRRRSSSGAMSLVDLVRTMLQDLVWGECRRRVLAVRLRQARQIARRSLSGSDSAVRVHWLSVVRAYRMATSTATDDAQALSMPESTRLDLQARVVRNACAVLERLLPMGTMPLSASVLALLYTARTGVGDVLPVDCDLYRYLPNAHALRQYRAPLILNCYRHLTTARRALVKRLSEFGPEDRASLYALWQ